MPINIIPGIKIDDVEGSIYSYIKNKLGLKYKVHIQLLGQIKVMKMIEII